MLKPTDVREHNRLLRGLPEPGVLQFSAALTRVTVEVGDVAVEPNEPIDFVYLPETAVASVIQLMADGAGVEVLTVGREGIVNAETLLGAETSLNRTLWQIGGATLRMPVAAFRGELERQPALRTLVGRYLRVVMIALTQSVACNRLHDVEQRAARWLLMTRDRVGADDFALTQEFLAFMLGVTRPNVTLAALSLQRAGVITYRRGKIRIVDGQGLEATACECYQLVRDEYDRLFDAAGHAALLEYWPEPPRPAFVDVDGMKTVRDRAARGTDAGN